MTPGPSLVCPGCGSPDIDLRRGLTCGTCAPSAVMPTWVLDALDDNARRKLILSWRAVPGRGLVVVSAGMQEVELKTEADATLFLAGVSSALTAFHSGGEGDPDA
jgi:hypothetical protein